MDTMDMFFIKNGRFCVFREAYSVVNVTIIDCLNFSIFRFLCLDHYSFAKGNDYEAWTTGAAFAVPVVDTGLKLYMYDFFMKAIRLLSISVLEM